MNKKLIIPCLLSLLLLTNGCSTVKKETKGDSLRMDLADVKNSLSEINWNVEELNNKLLLLQEKVEANKESVESITGTSPRASKSDTIESSSDDKTDKSKSAEQFNAPKDLKVVKLKKPDKAQKNNYDSKNADELYSIGQDFFLSGNYEKARQVFSKIFTNHIKHSLADNALYWSGESYYAEQRYEQAIDLFKVVTEKYPTENKAPDAFLKIALSYIELDGDAESKITLNKLIKKYPDSEATIKGRKLLDTF